MKAQRFTLRRTDSVVGRLAEGRNMTEKIAGSSMCVVGAGELR